MTRPLYPSTARITLAGIPFESAPYKESVRLRIFDTENSHLIVARLFGAGWSLNLGALAVKLNMLRPDDSIADLSAYVPTSINRALRILPWMASVTAWCGYAVGMRRGGTFPTRWDAGTYPRHFSRPWVSLGLPAALSSLTALWSTTNISAHSSLSREQINMPLNSKQKENAQFPNDSGPQANTGQGMPEYFNNEIANPDTLSPTAGQEHTADSFDHASAYQSPSHDILRHTIAAGLSATAAGLIAVSLRSARTPKARHPEILAALATGPLVTTLLTTGALRSALSRVALSLKNTPPC